MRTRYQIQSAIGACRGRIENGADLKNAFADLLDDISDIYAGASIYESQDGEDGHLSDCACHNEPSKPNEACSCGFEPSPNVEFETQYQLEQFREIEGQYFDEYNIHYAGTQMDRNCAQKMLNLINQMEYEIKKHARFYN
jgi:hypothetical protein